VGYLNPNLPEGRFPSKETPLERGLDFLSPGIASHFERSEKHIPWADMESTIFNPAQSGDCHLGQQLLIQQRKRAMQRIAPTYSNHFI